MLWVYRYVARPAMKAGTVLRLNDLKAIRNMLDGWYVVVVVLR